MIKNKAETFESFKRGNTLAFCEVYTKYYNKLYRYGMFFCNDSSLVEDVIQEFFVKTLKNPEKLNHVLNIEVYMFRSIKLNVISEKQKNNRRGVIRKLSVDQENYEISREKSIIEEETSSLKKEWMVQQIKNLPPYLKEIIYLRYYEGFSYEKISQITSLNKQVARNYVSRAIQKIRSKIEKGKTFLFTIIFGFSPLKKFR
ncbi:RNA polymerase sigma factor [Aquimarina hainanensis]|uniref:RNA polymerase sigma factor n=1 Tax=Aquimarina hainanensis TaxID=1578017 RepID=A0ABW5NA79_9FLAO|nr:sigma-70 family RNA polymerase sigma factor [Aquimarina sp. TRL1]QKX05408.1 sigma-70 family RNA polymerase sigma factor [Aquimarina sp. TRL1]